MAYAMGCILAPLRGCIRVLLRGGIPALLLGCIPAPHRGGILVPLARAPVVGESSKSGQIQSGTLPIFRILFPLLRPV
jgi:hypothetical protein